MVGKDPPGGIMMLLEKNWWRWLLVDVMGW